MAAKSVFFMATARTVELPYIATLLVEVAQSLCLITFNRPKKLNALSTELLQDIIRLSHWLYTRDEIRLVIIAGAGRMFSSGFDLGNLKSATVGELPRASADLGRLAAEALTNVPQLTIAAVHGHCVTPSEGGLSWSQHATCVLPHSVQLLLFLKSIWEFPCPGAGYRDCYEKSVQLSLRNSSYLVGRLAPKRLRTFVSLIELLKKTV